MRVGSCSACARRSDHKFIIASAASSGGRRNRQFSSAVLPSEVRKGLIEEPPNNTIGIPFSLVFYITAAVGYDNVCRVTLFACTFSDGQFFRKGRLSVSDDGDSKILSAS